MGLENLKSAFSNIKLFDVPLETEVGEEISQPNVPPDLTTMVSQYSIQASPQEVDFMGGSNSYRVNIDPPVSGFSANFVEGGYAFGVENKGNSKFIDIDTGNYIDYHDPEINFSYDMNNTWSFSNQIPQPPETFTYGYPADNHM